MRLDPAEAKFRGDAAPLRKAKEMNSSRRPVTAMNEMLGEFGKEIQGRSGVGMRYEFA